MSKYIMECGHADNALLANKNKTKIPICTICGCIDIEKEITSPADGLDARKAICSQHKNGTSIPVPSRWDLPFFSV